jgi:hypothetical protein
MKMMTDDPALALAQHVCRTSYADLPASAILDTFGCMLGGSGSPAIGELFAVVSRWGGLAEIRVLLRGVSLPSPQAALLNASMGHALDFDDTLDTGGSIHPGVSVLGAVLSISDSLGNVTGTELLLAVALRLDVSCRIALASTVDRGWHRTAAMGVFGAAAAAGKLLPEAGTHVSRIPHRLQSGSRQPPMHSGRRFEQAAAGRPGCQCRRFRRRSGANRGLLARATSLMVASGFSNCTSRMGRTFRCCFATWERRIAGRR